MKEGSVAAAVLTRGRARSIGNLATRWNAPSKEKKRKLILSLCLWVHYLKVSIELIIILFQILLLT